MQPVFYGFLRLACGKVISVTVLTPDEFLDALGRIPQDFDAETLQPKPGLMLVMHPDVAASMDSKFKEWSTDPEFKAKCERLLEKKRQDWSDREVNRKLVD